MLKTFSRSNQTLTLPNFANVSGNSILIGMFYQICNFCVTINEN